MNMGLDLQRLMDAIAIACEDVRSEYGMTLGRLRDAVAACGDGDTFEGFANPNSYRGYYSDLAFALYDNSEKTRLTKQEMLDMLDECDGKTFDGYKGGDFTMSGDTPLWTASWGNTGVRIMDIEVTEVDDDSNVTWKPTSNGFYG